VSLLNDYAAAAQEVFRLRQRNAGIVPATNEQDKQMSAELEDAKKRRARLLADLEAEAAPRRLAERRELLKLAALGPERTVSLVGKTAALVATDDDLRADDALTRDYSTALMGQGGSGALRIRNRKDAARYLYDNGLWRELERLGVSDGNVRALILLEMRHAGRPWAGSMTFQGHVPGGVQLSPPPLELP
jgi:hypothetical protein